MILYSTFITGLEEVICDILEKSAVVETFSVLNGAVIYEILCADDKTHEYISKFHFFNNTYEVLYSASMNCDNAENNILRHIIKNSGRINFRFTSEQLKAKPFRIMNYSENTPVSCDANLKSTLENIIKKQTGYVSERGDAGNEYCTMYRREGVGLFLKRLTDNTTGKKAYERGELRRELCYIMNYISEPKGAQICIDPFAGSGAILFSRINNFKDIPEKIILCDKDEGSTELMKTKFEPCDCGVEIYNDEFFSAIKKIPDNFVDVIVTDPPWGIYDKSYSEEDIRELYEKMFAEFCRILKKCGYITILTAKNDVFYNIANKYIEQFEFYNTYSILVSGKKSVLHNIKLK